MSDRSRPKSRRIKGFGLALVASMMMSVVAVSSASALSATWPSPAITVNIPPTLGTSTFSTENGGVTCTNTSGYSQGFMSKMEGEQTGIAFTLMLTGCKETTQVSISNVSRGLK